MSFVRKMVGLGQADLAIPDKFTDIRESINELTVEEIALLEQRIRSIIHLAEMKNRLYNEFGDPAKQLQTLEALYEDWSVKLRAHPDFDQNRAVNSQGDLSAVDNAAAMYQDLESQVKNAEHILLHADNDKVGGEISELLMGLLKGRGRYENQGESGKANDMIALKNHFKAIIDKFGGEKAWQAMHNEVLVVNQLKGNPKIGKGSGKITRGELFVMMLNVGNEGNIDRLTKGFGITKETIQEILDQHLDEKHAVAAQSILDIYKSYFPRVQKLHEEMNGATVEMVEATPFTHKGRVYPGGYYRIMYQSDMSIKDMESKFKQLQETATGDKQASMQKFFYADDMTKHGHTEQRSGGTGEAITLKMNSIGMGFETVLHDLNFRKPIADGLKVLLHKPAPREVTDANGKKTEVQDPSMLDLLGSVVGINDARVVVNTFIEAAGSVQMENNAMMDSDDTLNLLGNMLRGGSSAAYLVLRASTIGIQPASLVFAFKEMGPKGGKHLFNVARVAASNPRQMAHIAQLAADINPAIRMNRNNVDENARDPISKFNGKRYKFVPKALRPIDKMIDGVNEFGYSALSEADQIQKVFVTVGAYTQFLAGDAPGFDHATVMAMPKEQRIQKAKNYAAQVTTLNLTAGSQVDKSELQKKQKLWTMFFNDIRSSLNNIKRSTRKMRQALTNEEWSYAKRGMHFSREAAVITVTLATARVFMALVRGDELPEFEWPDDLEHAFDMSTDWGAYLTYETWAAATFGSVPFFRDIAYAMNYEELFGRDKTVTAPITQAAENIKDTVQVGLDFMEIILDERDITMKEAKALAFTFSYFRPIPVTALFKLAKASENIEEDVEEMFDDEEPTSMISEFSEKVDEFAEENEAAPEELQIDQEYVDELMEIKDEVQPFAPESSEFSSVGGQLPEQVEDQIDIIREIESGGKWNAKNPNSTAAGLYQFLEGTWEEVMNEAPELELTANGRVSKDTTQQEKAMRWFTARNIRTLKANDIEPTTENLYAAHFLGRNGAVKVLSKDKNTKMKTLVSDDVIAANHFPSAMTVGDFEEWLMEKVADGVKSVDKRKIVADKTPVSLKNVN